MNELIDNFLEAAKDETKTLDIGSLLSEDEILQWEILVKAMDGIDIMHIGRDLGKISKTYQLDKWQEMSILAYVKVLEMMVKAAKETSPDIFGPEEIQSPDAPTQDSYNGSMFG